MIKNFPYNDIILYAKGWYKRTDVVSDLGYLFGKVYGWVSGSEHEIANMMLKVVDMINDELKDEIKNTWYAKKPLSSFYSEVHDHYVCLYNVSFDMGVILWCLSRMLELEAKHIELIPPHYGKGEHFRMEGKPSMTYAEMNRIAKRMFDKKK